MSLNNISLSLGAATCSVTGGTATVFSPSSEKVANGGVKIINANVADPRERQVITAYASVPRYDSTKSTWTDESREIAFAIPVLQPDGTYKFRSVRLKFNFEAGISDANLGELRSVSAQLAFLAGMNTFFQTGSPA